MKLSSQFTVPAAPERVFPLFLDADVMRDSIPGCAELVRADDETYRGRLENVIAHVRFNARFSATIVSIDSPHEVKALLTGEDRKLGSSIKIDATLSVRPDPAGSLVGYEMEMALWGKIGRLGEAIVRRRSVEIERQFVERFSAACTEQAAASGASVPDAADKPLDTASVAAPRTEPAPAGTATARPVAPTAPARQASGARRGWWKSLWESILRRIRPGRSTSGGRGSGSGR